MISDRRPSAREAGGPRSCRREFLDFCSLRKIKCVLDFDAKIPNRRLYLGMAQKDLNRTEITSLFIN